MIQHLQVAVTNERGYRVRSMDHWEPTLSTFKNPLVLSSSATLAVMIALCNG